MTQTTQSGWLSFAGIEGRDTEQSEWGKAMGWSFGRSFGLGKLIRFNVGKRGVGVSMGIPGARVGMDARGRMEVRGGRGGIRFRQRIGGGGGSGSVLNVTSLCAAAAMAIVALLFVAMASDLKPKPRPPAPAPVPLSNLFPDTVHGSGGAAVGK